MDRHDVGQVLQSDALKANLLETAGTVEIDSELLLLLSAVKKYRGLHKTLEKLLYEICHPFRNWKLILPQFRSYTLKNTGHYLKDESGPEAVGLFARLFFEAIEDVRRDPVLLAQAVAALLIWLEKLAKDLPEGRQEAFEPVLTDIFSRLTRFDEEDEAAMMQMVYGQCSLAGLVRARLSSSETEGADCSSLVRLYEMVLHRTYAYWLLEDDPLQWFLMRCKMVANDLTARETFKDISHLSMQSRLTELKRIRQETAGVATLRAMLGLASHIDIVRFYRAIPDKLAELDIVSDCFAKEDAASSNFNENRKILFLFKIMDTEGLHLVHEETLREINRSLVQLIRQQTFEEIEEFLLATFELLEVNVRKYPHTSLQCIQVLGGEVFDRSNSRMVEAFLWGVVRFGFQHANVVGVDENWQPLTNPAHLANIRVWLHLIMREPKWCATLFSALIIHIKLSGTCIKDTDLFQRDITELLNHPIKPVYNLCKQFAKLMPVFFNEIGSEGELRDVSTELDEMHRRKDVLIHFLRKQGHVESSNLIVDFIKAIFLFWQTKDKSKLQPHVPDEVYVQVSSEGRYVDEAHRLTLRLWQEQNLKNVSDLLGVDEETMAEFLLRQQDIDPREVRRFELLVRMFKLLHAKYQLSFQDLRPELLAAAKNGFPQMRDLLDRLDQKDVRQSLSALLQSLLALKEIILSEESFEAREDIYYKRHIAVDIPSVYGRYKERKFDALSLSFRLENHANIYLEKLAGTINLAMITQATFYDIIGCLKLYIQALSVDGISSRKLVTSLSLLKNSLKVRRFSYTQYLDIFKGMSEGVKDIIYAFYTNIHQNNLSIIIPQLSREEVMQKYRSLYDEDMGISVHRVSEAFLRELISSTFGLQHLDNFILQILATLENQREMLSERNLDLLMTYNPNRAISELHNPNPLASNLIYLGNKGFNLATLAADNKPIPPAFVITTEVFRCRNIVFGYSEARQQFMGKIRRSLTELEDSQDKFFGSSDRPLLLSVRSGGAISMPGMMATVHNVGFNQEIIREYARKHGEGYFAWDNYRRFLQSWAMICDVDREDFQALMDSAKQRHGVRLKRDFTSAQMEELALSYYQLVCEKGVVIPDNPWLQLVGAIELVLDSWHTTKATDYRRVMDLSESWGTAVIVQTMIYGNKSSRSGSGVVFTSHPYRKVQRVALWGDYAYGSQGEDIVSGLVTSYAISMEQAQLDGRSAENTLERKFPKIYAELLSMSRELVYGKGWNPQEIEFTFEGEEADQLYILQSRDMITIKKKEHLQVFEESVALQEAYLGHGVGVSGSALSGLAVFTEEHIAEIRARDADVPLILIRQDTVPEDIKIVDLADGLLTSRGGQTSHASVVAVRLEKTCVVGCRRLKVFETLGYCEIRGKRIHFADPVSIDGRSGQLLVGIHPIKEEYHILPI
ncbi:PEP/pyruvate-binding domain-containing protein [Desulfotalea psychrophila]|uniref:Probable phosphoenolpyruvate synthase/pyruvate phosphate dikinase n=1 Tax=Desulfotalea psychrophila (strain LSv54 / DSM 12343) TaxID=177439 RepID=Q6AQ21_DESPS|nr:PEP/pyruvate-binding domain-containing protein [Desulfotalea psychrophila]CAG35552.1 probable phosphoenolpyruvate synthase/pyruvate phosphate dikinase [Desulfotalea psychrophila LSv54]